VRVGVGARVRIKARVGDRVRMHAEPTNRVRDKTTTQYHYKQKKTED
jgi:hypothetical protein